MRTRESVAGAMLDSSFLATTTSTAQRNVAASTSWSPLPHARWPIPFDRATSPPTNRAMAAMFHFLTRSCRKGTARSATQMTRLSRKKAAGVALTGQAH